MKNDSNLKYKFLSAILLSFSLTIICTALCYSFFTGVYESVEIKEASLFNKNENYSNTTEYHAVNTTPTNLSDISLVPLGDIFGIKLYTDGVIVTSLQEITVDGMVSCPAKDAGINPGDYIVSINGTIIENNSHLSTLISENLEQTITLEVKRNDQIFHTIIKPVYDGEYFRFGMWIRDSAAGIGTLTYYNPVTGDFGGLGHGICDIDTGELMILKNGEPSSVTISHIDKGTSGTPGKISGYFNDEISLGILYNNNETGIYGSLNFIPEEEAIPIALKSEVEIGSAWILTTINNGTSEYYSAEIESIDNDKNKLIKNFVIKITDEELLEVTGGIIQGMSGSPIIQDGKLIGAVTHVFVDDPTRGYGIFIENMLESAENITE